MSKESGTKLLGLGWNESEDTISISFEKKDSELTKRGVLQTLTSIYDPLGIVLRVTLIHCKRVNWSNKWFVYQQFVWCVKPTHAHFGHCYDNYVIGGPTVILLDQQIFADLTKHIVQMTQNM